MKILLSFFKRINKKIPLISALHLLLKYNVYRRAYIDLYSFFIVFLFEHKEMGGL